MGCDCAALNARTPMMKGIDLSFVVQLLYSPSIIQKAFRILPRGLFRLYRPDNLAPYFQILFTL